MSTTTMDNIVLRFKESTKQKPVTFRSYIFTLKGNTQSMTGIGKWHTRVSYKIQKINTYYLSFLVIYIRQENTILDIRHKICS